MAVEGLESVLAPLRVGPLTLRNRVLVPAHTTNFGVEHLPSERHLAYHRERAAGRVGAIIFESIRVHRNSLGRPAAVAGFEAACIAPFAAIAAAVQAEGAKLLGQIIHLGRQIDGDFERTVSWGPSPVAWSTTAPVPHAIDEREMEQVIAAHVRTARNLLEAGLDGIELQMGHGHLLQQFLSPLSNRRCDGFGGTLENRMRFPAAVLAAVREAVGPGVCLGIRLSGSEFVCGGLELAEATEIAAGLAAATPIDFVNVTHSAYHASASLATQMADMAFDVAPFRELPRAVRARLRADGRELPVFAVCRFGSLEEAEAMIASGGADAVGMARAHIAEPALVAKTIGGRTAEIRPCIACNQGCAGMLEKNIPITCLVNPRAGREDAWPEPSQAPAPQPRRVLVIGGGPAGMEAAWVAAARGHSVTLWEASDRLGGRLRGAASQMELRHEYLRGLDFQRGALAHHGVDVRCGVAADMAAVAEAGGDAVVVATGARAVAPSLEGGGAVLTLEDALARDAGSWAGEHVAVADLTGELSSLSVIEWLARAGARVTVLSPIAGFAWRTTIYSTLGTSARLRGHGVRIATLRRAVAWDGSGLSVRDESTGSVEILDDVTALVMAVPDMACDALGRELGALRSDGVAVEAIGDCVAPRTALEAIYQGHELAMNL